MKKILFLMSAMLVLTLTSFGQTNNFQSEIKPYTTPPENIYANFQKAQIKDAKERYKESSGTYLIKARNQILSGFGMQVFAGTFFIVSANITAKNYNTNFAESSNPSYRADLTRNYNSTIMCEAVGACFLGVVGLGFQISGICNIGKAGLSLDANGVGVKVNF